MQFGQCQMTFYNQDLIELCKIEWQKWGKKLFQGQVKLFSKLFLMLTGRLKYCIKVLMQYINSYEKTIPDLN